MRSNYKRLGNYISLVGGRNRNLKIENLIGLSIQKKFIPSISNTIGTDMSTYRILNKNQFAYCSVTSRNGEKITVALYQEDKTAMVSQAYDVFEINDEKELLPEYLMMWFRRPEFDRYARYMSHGSVREMFSWEEMCEVKLPIPHPDKQKVIVKEYNTIVNRININNQLIQKLEEAAQAIYKQWFVDFEFPVPSPPVEGCPQDGVVKRNSHNYFDLPYNPALKDRAKALRKAGNLAEVLFWRQVRNKSFKGLDFDRQKIIGNYIVDFYCPNNQVVIEIDGNSHDNKQEYDAARDDYLKSLGLEMIHITDADVKNNIDSVMRFLAEHPVFNSDIDHPVFQAPLHRRGIGYKSSGGEMVENEMGEVPKNWRIENLKSICLKIGSGATPKGGKEGYQNSGISLIRSMNVHDYIFLINDLAFIDEVQAKALDGVTVKEYDILFNITGVSVARCCIVPKFILPARVNQHVMLIRPNPKDNLSHYLLCTLCYSESKSKLLGISQSGSTREAITKSEIEGFKIIKPSNEIAFAFKQKATKIFANIEFKILQNHHLNEMKDLLLSRLATIEN